MANANDKLMQDILQNMGSRDNVESAMNCMTRLRFHVKDGQVVNKKALENLDGVLGVVHDRDQDVEVVVGPGKSRKLADIAQEMGIPTTTQTPAQAAAEANARNAAGRPAGRPEDPTAKSWQENKRNINAQQKDNPLKAMLKTFGEIFVPLIPGVIAAGLCAGVATLLQQLIPGWKDNTVWLVIINILTLINQAFMLYLPAWAGYRAAERFGGTPILGGMLGMITGLAGIDGISAAVGLFNEAQPLDAILRAGRGGVLAAVLGVWVMVKIERAIRKRMLDSLDIVLTPLLTLLITVVPYIFIVMPLTGLISTGLVRFVQTLAMNGNPIIRILAGFVSSALFLPMVAMGMHHGLVALYTVQLESLGFVTLYPALAMAGAGQVGAAIALYRKAKRIGNARMQSVIKGALPAGVLGVGEPLIYGLTLPLGKPFFTAGLGAGFGGAFVMAMQVASTTWGPSGVIAFFVMTAGPAGAAMSMVYYGIGLLISYIMGYVITNVAIKAEELPTA